MSNKEYEQAFPTRDDNYDSKYSGPGMTLRDYFAAAALTGLLANSEAIHAGAEPTNSCLISEARDHVAKDYAESSYRVADAMLAARSEQGGGR